VLNIVIFSQERSPIIEVLEERLLKAAEERCAAAIGVAAADDAEELRAPEAAIAAAVGVLSRGARSSAVVSLIRTVRTKRPQVAAPVLRFYWPTCWLRPCHRHLRA